MPTRPARNAWPKLLLVPAILLAAILVGPWLVQFHPEPTYRGKPLTTWVQTYTSSAGRHSREWDQTDDAVCHLGTNCLPILMKMIRQSDSKLKVSLIAFAQRQPFFKIHFAPAAERNLQASRAFIALGDLGKEAVPALIRTYNENISTDSQAAIEDAFAWIGPSASAAIPLLLRAANDSNAKLRASALWALGDIHTQPQTCVPALINALSDSNDWVQLSAAHALGMFGSNALSAVPVLTEFITTPTNFKSLSNMQPSLEARNALKKIDPQVVLPPGRPVFPEFAPPSLGWPIAPQ